MRYLTILALLLIPSSGIATELDGQSDFSRRVEVTSSLSARIASVEVAVGQRVASGEVVVTLVTTGLQAAVDLARAESEALRPLVQRRLTELEKAQELFARDSLAVVELQNAEQDHAIALSRLAAAEAKLANARYLLAQAQIRSPIDGVVIEVDAFAGQFVNTRAENRRLLTIVDPGSMTASASLPYELAAPSLLRRPATVRYGDREYRGRVIEIGRRVTIGDNNHPAVVLRVGFESDGRLAAGLPVRITIADE
jgi:RND family efflux transporter MFP subunit